MVHQKAISLRWDCCDREVCTKQERKIIQIDPITLDITCRELSPPQIPDVQLVGDI